MGSGDQVPDALRRMGLDVTLLDDDQLASGDLSRSTLSSWACGVGGRPAFVANNGRLRQFIERGGTLIVQYQQTDYDAPAPLPLPRRRTHASTDESAPITVLQPQHPVFNFPNRSPKPI